MDKSVNKLHTYKIKVKYNNIKKSFHSLQKLENSRNKGFMKKTSKFWE